MALRRNTVNTVWFRLALFFDAMVFLSAAGKGYFAYMTEQAGKDFQTNWNIILVFVIIIILICLLMARQGDLLALEIFNWRISLSSSMISFPYLVLLLILFYSEPMVVGTYFLGGLIGLLILMWMAIMVSGLRQEFLEANQEGILPSTGGENNNIQTIFLNRTITREDIFGALREFNRQYPYSGDFENWLHKANYKYSIDYDGEFYPPKKILSIASGIAMSEFSGGEQTNQVFRQLGFDIVDK